MAEHTITILNRIASVPADAELVCNNPTDTIRFEFDEEWSGIAAKTARFSWEGKYIDAPFSGNVVKVPEIFQTNYVYVGVFAENITSTPVKVKCRYSIKCLGGKVVAPSADVYSQIIELINAGINANDGVGISTASINASGHLMITLTNGNVIDCGIAKGADGTGVTILGSYDSYESLVAACPTGAAGDSYIVQGNLYVWSETDADWINVGSVQGPAGEQGAQGLQGEKGEQGATGADGEDGKDGVGIKNIERTDGTGSPGTTDTYTITLTDGNTYMFTVYNGADGSGSSSGSSGDGDMKKSIYDTNGNGVVDNSEKLGGNLPAYYAKADHAHTEYADASHTHEEYLTEYEETDPTVPTWAKAANKPTYTKSEVGLSNVDNVRQYSASNPPPYPVTSVNGATGAVTVEIPDVPTKTSELTNDSGFITEYTETDPTVPAWAKEASKPTYTASEVGAATENHTHTLGELGVVYVDELPETGVEGILYLVPVE